MDPQKSRHNELPIAKSLLSFYIHEEQGYVRFQSNSHLDVSTRTLIEDTKISLFHFKPHNHFPKLYQGFHSLKLYEADTCNIGLTEPALALWYPFLYIVLKLAKCINFLIDFREHGFPDNRTKISK